MTSRARPRRFTPCEGKYTARGWTEWTQGFVYGSAILQYDATGDEAFLKYGREQTVARMAHHITHVGVHDHGFNNVSTYGNLWRLMNEGRLPENAWERNFYETRAENSGAVQADRWTRHQQRRARFIYSFNGPHSLFADTIRSLPRAGPVAPARARAHGRARPENFAAGPLVEHARATAQIQPSITARGAISTTCADGWRTRAFSTNNGDYRCPNSQQGYAPFSTWTRGLAWIMCGYPEELEWLATVPDEELAAVRRVAWTSRR